MQLAGAETIEHINPGLLIVYEDNSRIHTPVQVQQIADSITEFGFANPLLIDESGVIIAGHGRLLAAQLLKLDTVPCVRLKHLSASQKVAYLIADNQLALNSEWDYTTLFAEVDKLRFADYDISVLGFSTTELERIAEAAATESLAAFSSIEIPEGAFDNPPSTTMSHPETFKLSVVLPASFKEELTAQIKRMREHYSVGSDAEAIRLALSEWQA